MLKKLFSNPAIIYVASRYATYAIQFVNTIFIAVYLGPFYLGIWGFITMIVGYLNQFTLGIPNAVNVISSIHKSDENYVRKIVGNGVLMTLFLMLFVVVCFLILKFTPFKFGEKYNFETYLWPVLIISSLAYFNTIFSKIFRLFGKVNEIAINQSLFPVLTLLVLPFFRDKELLWALVIVYTLSFVISFILYIKNRPISLMPLFDKEIVNLILNKGWLLFINSASFYFILLSTKSFISENYTVKEFGYFTFSYSLANAILLMLNSISFLLTPKIINRFSKASNKKVREILANIRSTYIGLSHGFVHFFIMLFPLFLYFFKEYEEASDVFKLTALTVVLYTNSFGYQGFLFSRGKEKGVALIAFSSLILNIILVGLLIYVVKVSFVEAIIGTMITYVLYNFFIAYLGNKIIEQKSSFLSILKDIYPINIVIPFLLSCIFAVLKFSDIYFIIPFIVYVVLNYKQITTIKNTMIQVVKNKNFINI